MQKKLLSIFSFLLLALTGNPLFAQTYCTPTFTNGCTSSNYISQVTFAGISNTQTGCTVSNFTAMSANVTAGVDSFMTVITAGWDGVGVYVDMNKDGNFTVDERLFTQYKALTPPITYGNIPINIPLYVRTGAYRLRVLVGNGFGWPSGGCGNTAYGNYHDYTLNVTNNNPSMNNAGVSALNGPTNFCPDSQMVSVVVKNYGLNQINYVDVNWSIDGVLQTPVSSYATIDTIGSANGTTTVVNLGKVYFGSAAKVLSAWTSLPNFVTDTLTADDSLSNKSIVASMNGTYTIGGTNPDFATINAAINFLNIAGICGPVTFNIRPGTYAEKLVVKAIVGASDSNRVVFQSEGNNNTLVILTAATTSNTDGVVKFNGASYVTIKDISINQTNTTASAAVVINGTAVKDSLVNCIITTAATTTSGTYAISASSAGMNATVLKGNVVTGGYYGLYFYGSSTTSLNQNCVIEGNTISGAYYYTVYAYYCNNLKFLKNIVRSQGLASTHYLATFGYCDNGLVVSGNEFSSTSHTSTLYGLRIYYCDGAASNPGLISNNTLYFNTTGTLYGLYSYYSSYQNYYHNSVYGNSSGATNYPTYIYHTSATYANITFRNNIFSNYGTTGYAAYIYSPNFINSNFNLYYSNSAGLIYKGIATATNYAHLASYRSAFPTQEVNSLVYRPAFTSTSNLAINANDSAAWAVNGKGEHQTYALLDKNNSARPTYANQGVPDLGAFEVTPTALAPQATPIPALPVAGTTQRFLFGGDTIAKVSWDASYGAPSYLTVRYYTGEIPPNSSSTQLAMRAYWDMDAPSGSYSYNLELPYRDSLMGNLPVEVDMKLSVYQSTWNNYLSSASMADTLLHLVTASSLNSFGLFAVTDDLNPLPVKLSKISANYLDGTTSVYWTSAAEKNVSHFDIERSFDGINFSTVGSILAKGNSSLITNYTFDDLNAGRAMEQANVLFYRLRMVDQDSKFEYSKVLLVRNTNELLPSISLYPNPFKESITLSINQADAGEILYSLYSYSGIEMEKGKLNGPQGASHLVLDNWNHLQTGVYFLQVAYMGEIHTIKLIKQ